MHRVQVLSLRIPAVDLIDAYIKVVEIIPLVLIKAIILDHDAKTRDELELKPELNTRVLVDLKTPIIEELNLNSIVAYNITEYNVIN